jgi:hypothetical protein
LRGRTFPSKSDSFIKKTVRICEALRDDFLEKIALERVALKIKRGQRYTALCVDGWLAMGMNYL